MLEEKQPLVSIIIPCYKAEKELPAALASISQQTHTHWEIIAINDCWPDNTESILLRFQEAHTDREVRFLRHKENKGLGATRNTGIAAARGAYIAFLDHDDIWEPNHLANGLQTLKSKQGDIYYSSVKVFNANGTGNEWIWGPTPEDLQRFPETLFGRNFIQPSSAIFTSCFLKRLGPMDINPKLHFCEDHDYWIRAINLGGNLITSDEVTVRYRYANPDAATAKIPLMIKNDIYVQKKHLKSAYFRKASKHRAISANYRRLANYFWTSNHPKSLFYLLQSIYWFPANVSNLKQFLKGLVYWPNKTAKTQIA